MINQILSTEVSWYWNISDTIGSNKTDLKSILYGIRTGGDNGVITSRVNKVRAEIDKDKRRELKKELPVIMWQGQFSQRSKQGLLSLSGILCIDIDHLPEHEIVRLRSIFTTVPWIISAFRSPSGDGLKVLIKTSISTVTDYENCYCQLMDYFLTTFGCKVDKNCKDISRACYASYDPDIYVASSIKDFPYVFDPKYTARVSSTGVIPAKNGYSSISLIRKHSAFLNHLQSQIQGLSDNQIIEILDRRFSRYPQNYTDGHRTKSIFAQATKLCLAGIEDSLALAYLKKKFLPTGYDEHKLEYEAGKAYEKTSGRFGSERGDYKSYHNYKTRTN